MLSFAYLSTRNLENLFHFNGMGNGMLIICEARKEVGSTRDTLIYFFLTFRVSCQFKETCASTMSVKRISGPYINSVNLTLSLPLQKVQKVQGERSKMYSKNWTLILELTKLLSLIWSTTQAVVPARLQIRNLQQLQIQSLKLKKSFQMNVKLTALAKQELPWWISNLQPSNGKAFAT